MYEIQGDLNALTTWFTNNELILNIKKTKLMLFGSSKRLSNSELSISNNSLQLMHSSVEKASTMKYLGVTFDPSMNGKDHVDNICSKISKRLGLLNRIRKFIDIQTSKQIYNTMVLPLFEYCDIIWSNACDTTLNRLYLLQKRGAFI